MHYPVPARSGTVHCSTILKVHTTELQLGSVSTVQRCTMWFVWYISAEFSVYSTEELYYLIHYSYVHYITTVQYSDVQYCPVQLSTEEYVTAVIIQESQIIKFPT